MCEIIFATQPMNSFTRVNIIALLRLLLKILGLMAKLFLVDFQAFIDIIQNIWQIENLENLLVFCTDCWGLPFGCCCSLTTTTLCALILCHTPQKPISAMCTYPL